MATISLRTPDDVKRLFTALGDVPLMHEGGGLSVAQLDEMSLSGAGEEIDMTAVGVSVLVAVAAGYSAIKGFQRNMGSMPWGVGWGVLGWLFPVPSVVYATVKS